MSVVMNGCVYLFLFQLMVKLYDLLNFLKVNAHFSSLRKNKIYFQV